MIINATIIYREVYVESYNLFPKRDVVFPNQKKNDFRESD